VDPAEAEDQEEDLAAVAAASAAAVADSEAGAVAPADSGEALIITGRTITDRTITADGFGDPDAIITVAAAALAA